MKIDWSSFGDENLKANIERYLNTREGVRNAHVVNVKRPKTGHSYDTVLCNVDWHFEDHQETVGLAFRIEIPDYQMFHDASLRKQYHVLKDIQDYSDLPVPKVYWYGDAKEYFGAPFLCMELVEGNVPPDYLAHRDKSFVMSLTEDERKRVYLNSITTLADIHRIDVNKNFIHLHNAIDSRKSVLENYLQWIISWYQWVARGRDSFSLIEKGLEYLNANLPTEASVSLVWGDARPGNMIIGHDLLPKAVIDWEMAGLGTPEIDLAWLLMWETIWYPNLKELRNEGFPTESEMIYAYEARLGRNVRDLTYYKVMAATRLSIMMVRGIDKRIELNRLPKETTLLTDNVASIYLARLLGQPEPQLSPDIHIIANEMQ